MSSQGQQDKVFIFDTTLRDGEQSPGATMSLAEKLEIARALAELKVDVIEAGFPIASPGDLESVRNIARQVEGPIICGLARCIEKDITAAWEALKDGERSRIHVFLATSAIHREFKLKMARDEIVKRAVEGVSQARALCADVEFSPEDAARTELDFLAEVVEKVIEAGATTINIPDTVGYTIPENFAGVIRYLKQHVRGIERAVLSVHCHNDLGLAVANSLSAVKEGARQIECTINGIGERAGNCSLEEIVMALKVRNDYYNLRTDINTKRLYPTSRLVSNVTGLRVQRNKAVVGENAFAHESGIHQHGMAARSDTYEIMNPEDVGQSHSQAVLGKHSGRAALRQRLIELGYHLDDLQLQKVFENFKTLADKKKEIYDADIEALVKGFNSVGGAATWEIASVHTSAGTGTTPLATVRLVQSGGKQSTEEATGDGPVDAVVNAVAKITGMSVKLRDYQVRSVTIGQDSQGEANIEVEYEGRKYRGRGVSTDIIEASAIALVNVINRILAEKDRSQEKDPALSLTP
jgi:2-isopropylmalate synthase